MSYRRPVQVGINGLGRGVGWRFVSEGEDGSIVPIGTCADLMCLHPTQNEARLCYRSFILDKRTLFFARMSDRQPCVVCKGMTDNMVEVDGTPQVRACALHANLRDVGDYIFAGGDEIIA